MDNREEASWISESVAQFVRSPLWTTPIHNFIDEHCVAFAVSAGEEEGSALPEQSLEHLLIHKKFQELVDQLLTSYIDELGVSAEQVLAACRASTQQHGQKVLEYLYAIDQFSTFASLMARRNAELEKEALQQLERSMQASLSAGPQSVGAKDDLAEREQAQIDAAIAASLAELEATRRRAAEAEDAELQEALRLSLLMEQQRAAADERAQVERRDATEETAHKAELSQHETTQALPVDEQRAEATHDARRESAPPSSAPTNRATPAAAVRIAPERSAGVTGDAAAADPSVAPVTPSPLRAAPSHPLVGAVKGRSGAVFGGFAKLPAIGHHTEPPVVVGADTAVKPDTSTAAGHEQVVDDEAAIREKWRKQREALLAAKKSERDQELVDFRQNNNINNNASLGESAHAVKSGQPSAAADAEFARQLARRFREDILDETKRKPT